MVIQRIQTVFLLIAAVCATVFLFIPYGYSAGAEGVTVGLKATQAYSLLVPTVLDILLSLVAIFMFKNMKQQKKVATLAALVSVAVVAVVAYLLFCVAGTVIGGAGLLMVAAFICQVMACRSISADIKLLRSIDTLR